jgi:hypothetical protein
MKEIACTPWHAVKARQPPKGGKFKTGNLILDRPAFNAEDFVTGSDQITEQLCPKRLDAWAC